MMVFLLYLCVVFVAPVYCCRSGDIKCKKKELFVILDLYKNYRELKDYHNLLLQIKENVTVTENGNQLDISGNQTNIGKAMDGSNNSNTLDYTGRYVDQASSKLNKQNSLSKHLELFKIIDELGTVVSAFRNLLFLILLSPKQIGIRELDLVLDALQKPKTVEKNPTQPEVVDRPTQPDNSITGSIIIGNVSSLTKEGLSLSPVTMVIPTTRPLTPPPTKPTTPQPIQSTAHPSISRVQPRPSQISPTISITMTHPSKDNIKRKKGRKLKSKKAKRNKRKRMLFMEAMNDHRDTMAEFQEGWAEFIMLQRFLYMFG